MQKSKLQFKIKKYHKLLGANMDIDLTSNNKRIRWKQAGCPWNEKEKSKKHKCATKNISLCKYFKGIKYPDVVICAFSKKL